MKKQKQNLPSNRYFGLFFSAIFAVIGIMNLGSENFLSIFVPAITAIFFLILSMFLPDALRPLNYLWIGLGRVLARICNPIIMGIIFFGLFAPVSIISRAFGRDELLVRNKRKITYWLARTRTLDVITDFKRQF